MHVDSFDEWLSSSQPTRQRICVLVQCIQPDRDPVPCNLELDYDIHFTFLSCHHITEHLRLGDRRISSKLPMQDVKQG